MAEENTESDRATAMVANLGGQTTGTLQLLRHRRKSTESDPLLLPGATATLQMDQPAESEAELRLGTIQALAELQPVAPTEDMSWLSQTDEDVCLKSRMT